MPEGFQTLSKRLLLLDVALLGLMVLASRAALVVHEAGGHALPAWAIGARRVAVRMSYFGGGNASAEFPPDRRPSGAGHVVYHLGGIALNVLTGAAAWVAARRLLRRRGLLHLFLLMFGAGSFGQVLMYLGNGFYYGTGDPQGFVRPGGDLTRLQWLWILFVPALGAAAYLAARGYLDWLAGHSALDTAARRMGWTLATIGVVALAYLGLWRLTWDSTVDVTLRERRLQEEVRREIARRAPPAPPPETARPATPPPPPVLEDVRREAEKRVPLPVAPIANLAAVALGAGLALWRLNPSAAPADFRAWPCLASAGLAGAALLAISLAGR